MAVIFQRHKAPSGCRGWLPGPGGESHTALTSPALPLRGGWGAHTCPPPVYTERGWHVPSLSKDVRAAFGWERVNFHHRILHGAPFGICAGNSVDHTGMCQSPLRSSPCSEAVVTEGNGDFGFWTQRAPGSRFCFI